MNIKVLPVIRHLRAIAVIAEYCWRAVFIWRITDQEHMDGNPLFEKDRERARRIAKGLE